MEAKSSLLPPLLGFMTTYCYPNISVILLTVHVTVDLAKRSLSKLKLLKNYLRSTISQERLDDFAMCNIEKAIMDTIDINNILMILHQETPEEIYFCEPMDIIECKYMVIKLILEVQINYYFSLQCFR